MKFNRKNLTTLLAILLLATFSHSASAYDFMVNGIAYNINSNGTSVTVTYTQQHSSYNYSGLTSANIPSSVTYNGRTYSVTAIGEYAFGNCSGLTSVTIPNSVTSIGRVAFFGCRGLTSVTIPNSVTSIGEYAFYNCSDLTSITIPNSVTSIGDEAFSCCNGLTSITIPNSVISIGVYAFEGCSGLESIIVETGNTTYDSRNNCNAIVETASNTLIAGCKNTIIPNSVTSIGNSAFSGCSGLTSLTIPNSVTFIGVGAFVDCSGLESVVVENGNTTYDSRNNCNAIIETSTNTLMRGCKNTIIPNSVTSIGNYAFSNCSGLTSVTIPNSVTFIGHYAFRECRGLTSITIPNSVTFIGVGAFVDCSGLTSVTIGNSVTSIGYSAFAYCSGLTSVTLGNSVTSIGNGAFYGCSGLISITIPNSVTSIESYAFGSCRGLKIISSKILNPNNITLGDEVFTYVNKANCYLMVPTASVDLYKNADQWKDFLHIVPDILATYIHLNKTHLSLFQNQTETLLASVSPSNAISEVYWSTSDENVVTVNQNGKVTAKALGSATITATTIDGTNLSASCQVTVTKPVTSITLNQTTAIIYQNCTHELTATVLPTNATNKSLTWTSSNTNVATVNSGANNESTWQTLTNNFDKSLPFKKIRVKPQNPYSNWVCYLFSRQPNGVSDGDFDVNTCILRVHDNGNEYGNSYFTNVGDGWYEYEYSETLYYLGSQTNVGEGYVQVLVEQGSNPGSGTGSTAVITAKSPGTTTITATTTDGTNLSASCEVTVVPEYELILSPNIAHVRGVDDCTYDLAIAMNNHEAISGIQFVLNLPALLTLVTDSHGDYEVWLDDARKARNHSVSVEPKNNNNYLMLISSPTNQTFKGNSGDILHLKVKVNNKYHSDIGDYYLTLYNIIMAEADETQHNVSSSQSKLRLSYLVGDANADSRVDVTDYVVTANHILGRNTGPRFFTDAANAAFSDNSINVTDLVAITNIALEIREKEYRPDISGYQLEPVIIMPGSDYTLDARVSEKSANQTIATIAVDNDEPLAAMQFDIDLPEGVELVGADVTERSRGLSASCGTSPDGKARVILSAFGDTNIESGTGDVLTLTLQGNTHNGDLLRVTDIVMTERNLIEHGALDELSLDLNTVTGVNEVSYDKVNIYGRDGAVIIESPVTGKAQLVRVNGLYETVMVKPGRNVYPVNLSYGDIIIVNFNSTTAKLQF